MTLTGLLPKRTVENQAEELKWGVPGGHGDQLGLLEKGFRMRTVTEDMERRARCQAWMIWEGICRIWGQHARGVGGRNVEHDSQGCGWGRGVEVAPSGGVRNPAGGARSGRLVGAIGVGGII